MLPKRVAKKTIHLINRLSGISDDVDHLKQNWLRSMNIQTVLDVGAHKGESAVWFHRILPEARIISFEPQFDCFNELAARMRGISNFSAYNFALGASNGNHVFYRSEHTPSSSLLEMGILHKKIHPTTAEIIESRVEVRRLDDVIEPLVLEPDCLLKMDTQGFEKNVILGATKSLEKISIVITEVLYQDLYEGQSTFSDIFHLLEQAGFGFNGTWLEGRRNPLNGLLLYADVIFIKKH